MNIVELTQKYVMNTYTRYPVTFVRGKGCWLYDSKGRKYLDMLAGIAVCNLGHCNKDVAEAVCKQAKKLVHVSNLFYTQPQAELAELLCKHSFGSRVFFCNSGAEANEAAIKLARKHGLSIRHDKYEIIAFENSFHGRTFASLSITGQEKYRKGFGKLLEGVKFATFNDADSVKKLASDRTAAIIVEPVQGEGGVIPAKKEFLKALREIATFYNAVLIFDEVQTGMGRTGRLFAYQHYGVTPDVMTLAKSLANGLPMGAIVVSEKFADVLTRGTHASTFGGNPLCASAAVCVLKKLTDEKFLKNVREKGEYLKKLLLPLKDSDHVEDIRGIGLMVGVVLKENCANAVSKLLEKGIVLNCTSGNVLRFLPPLIVSKKHLKTAVENLSEILKEKK